MPVPVSVTVSLRTLPAEASRRCQSRSQTTRPRARPGCAAIASSPLTVSSRRNWRSPHSLPRRSSRKVGFATARSCQPSSRSGGSSWLARCSAILAGQVPGRAAQAPSRFGSVVREGVGPRRRPGAVQVDDRRGRRPIPVPPAFQRLATAPSRVGARPVRRRRRTPVQRLPGAHRVAHPLAGPGWRDRAGMAALAVLVRVALTASGRGRRAAAAADALVAGLDRTRLLAGRVLSA